MSAPRTIACMKWGTRYGPEYANHLHASAKRNMSGEFRFVCFTEDSSGLNAGIEALPLPAIDLPERVAWTPWRKLSLWQDPLGDLTGDVLVLDLDLLITGPLDDFFTYKPGEFCVIENWTQTGEGIGNTSAFRIPVGRYPEIYDRVQADPEAVLKNWRIEQQYISDIVPAMEFWPRDWCLSFKHSILPPFPRNWWKTPELPADARIVAFTGQPDPHEAAEGHWPAPWYKKHYKHVRRTPWIREHWR